jgi:hypothetical protein
MLKKNVDFKIDQISFSKAKLNSVNNWISMPSPSITFKTLIIIKRIKFPISQSIRFHNLIYFFKIRFQKNIPYCNKKTLGLISFYYGGRTFKLDLDY